MVLEVKLAQDAGLVPGRKADVPGVDYAKLLEEARTVLQHRDYGKTLQKARQKICLAAVFSQAEGKFVQFCECQR